MTNFDKVEIFMKTFGQEVKDKPSLSTPNINNLRVSLIEEELKELKEAIKNNDLLEVADALTDITYKELNSELDLKIPLRGTTPVKTNSGNNHGVISTYNNISRQFTNPL